MKKYLFILLLINSHSILLNAQTLEITYVEKKIFREGAYDDMEPFIRGIILKSHENDKGYKFKLTHLKGKSIYQIANELQDEDISFVDDVKITRINDNQKNYIMYKDQLQNKMVNQASIFFRNFLIKGELHKFNWAITEEKKLIGKYMCIKATTATPMVSAQSVSAWYTEEIAINDGPREYWGLPGMILQIESTNENGEVHITTATSILFHNSFVEISPPTKGKVVTPEEYQKIVKQKVNESKSTMLDFDKN